MKEAILPLAGAGLTVAACYSLGALLIDSLRIILGRLERIPLAFILGAACLHLVVFVVLLAHLGYWPVLVLLELGIVGWAIRVLATNKHEYTRISHWFSSVFIRVHPWLRVLAALCFIVVGAYTVLYSFNAWAPEISPDGSGYHLSLVARYLRAHGFERITTNFYASLSQGVEMLFVPAFAVGKHSAAALVHFAFLIALGLAIFAYGLRLGKRWVGVTAAILTYASPIVGMDGTSAYNDVAVAGIVFAAYYFLELWDESRSQALLIPIGLLAGFAYATKYTAFVILPFALGFVFWRSRQVRPLLNIMFFSALMVTPWMLKNWIEVQNPVAPFANQYFRNPFVHVEFEKGYTGYLRSYDVKDKRDLPLEVTVRGGKTVGLTGPIFLLSPLGLLALRLRSGRRLLAVALVVGVTYFANVGTRFLIPSLPFVSLAIAMAFESLPPVLALLILFHAVSCWPSVVKRYAGSYAWYLRRVPVKQALRRIPEDRYLREASWSYGQARMIEANVPKGERVLTLNGLAEAYTTREVLVSFQSAPNELLTDMFNNGWVSDFQPTELRTLHFSPVTVSRVRLVQTASGSQQWSIHELRIFHQGVELVREPDWRLRAWPNPWDVQLAFDNNPATRWRTWEAAKPGMYAEVDFAKPQPLDEIHIETSKDSSQIQLTLQVSIADGKWVDIEAQTSSSSRAVTANLRRAATFEMHARGVNYLMLLDTDYGSQEVREDPESWALQEIAKGYGSQLYKVTW